MDRVRLDRPTCAVWLPHFAGMGLVFPFTSLYLRVRPRALRSAPRIPGTARRHARDARSGQAAVVRRGATRGSDSSSRPPAQGPLALVGLGFGGSASTLLTGHLMETLGERSPYQISGLGAMLPGVRVMMLLPAPTRPRDESSADEAPASAGES